MQYYTHYSFFYYVFLPTAEYWLIENKPEYNKCFAWINKNLIAYTLFPQIKNIKFLQKLITNNEKPAASLRYLQDTTDNLKVVKTDSSTKDTIAQIPKDQYEISDKDIVIDGASPDKINNENKVEEIETEANKSGILFVKAGYIFAFAFVMMF